MTVWVCQVSGSMLEDPQRPAVARTLLALTPSKNLERNKHIRWLHVRHRHVQRRSQTDWMS